MPALDGKVALVIGGARGIGAAVSRRMVADGAAVAIIYLSRSEQAEALADDLRAFGRTSPRYIVSPAWESFAETKAAIEAAGFTVEPIQTTHRRDGSPSFTLYQIKPKQTSNIQSLISNL